MRFVFLSKTAFSIRLSSHSYRYKHTFSPANVKSSIPPTRMSTETPHVVSREEMPASGAKWVTLEKIKYRDQDGKERTWEAATRKTRKESGIDAVAILAVLQPKDKSPPATVIIEQYRPPVDKFVVGTSNSVGVMYPRKSPSIESTTELPAGLIDAGETPEDAAIRELREETGFEAEGIIESSNIMVTDPGMTTANMKLVALRVPLEDENAFNNLPHQALEPGEHVVCKIVKLNELHKVLNDYSERGFVIDARLAHFAIGCQFGAGVARGEM